MGQGQRRELLPRRLRPIHRSLLLVSDREGQGRKALAIVRAGAEVAGGEGADAARGADWPRLLACAEAGAEGQVVRVLGRLAMGEWEPGDGEGFFSVSVKNCVKCGKVDPASWVGAGHVHAFHNRALAIFCATCFDQSDGGPCPEEDGGCHGSWKSWMGVKVEDKIDDQA